MLDSVQEERMRYCTSPLAVMRKAAGLTQTAAATTLGMKSKQHLCGIERGWRMASPAVMKAMQALYGVSGTAILRAAVDTFNAGPIMTRQAARIAKLAGRK